MSVARISKSRHRQGNDACQHQSQPFAKLLHPYYLLICIAV
ncbi:hypothetical protein BN871_AI_00760 [Paenibacillus sp. P22]|nr:hypothetical protein BN871_AI_00760 [Paenibacillus sp. P22]